MDGHVGVCSTNRWSAAEISLLTLNLFTKALDRDRGKKVRRGRRTTRKGKKSKRGRRDKDLTPDRTVSIISWLADSK